MLLTAIIVGIALFLTVYHYIVEVQHSNSKSNKK